MIIINEFDYVKQIIESKVIPKDISNKRLLGYIAKYYFDQSFSILEYKQFVFDKMKEFDLPLNYYQEYKYDSYVSGLCGKLLSGELSHELRKVESVNIYQSELDIVEQGENKREKKLLFTLFVLAKINGTESGWVNNETKDIFALANITATTKDRALLIHKLYKMGLIGQNHKNDKLGYKVELGSKDENVVVVIDTFENIGNQYIEKFKSDWKMCKYCKKLFKIKNDEGRPEIYCSEQCRYESNLKKQKDRDLKKKHQKS